MASAPVVPGVCLAVACGEDAAASARHRCLFALLFGGLSELVHYSRSLLHLAGLDEAFQSGCQPLLVGRVELGGVVCFHVLPDLCQASAVALLEVEHGVPQHGSHLHFRGDLHFHDDVSEMRSPSGVSIICFELAGLGVRQELFT